MPDLPISMASGNYDRIRALRDGTVRVAGCAVEYHVIEPNRLFARNLKDQEFDVSEMSFSTYVTLREQGHAHYTAIPVFLSRAFRHSAIFVRRGSGIASPADLPGKCVGTPEYFTTMLVWMRGLLSDEYGIKPSDLRWRIGGLEKPAGRALPTGPLWEDRLDIAAIPPGQTLSGMLAEGGIDALFSARTPSCFGRGDDGVMRLFADYRATEQAYYRASGIYPIMHAVGIRDSLVKDHPWLAGHLFAAYSQGQGLGDRGVRKTLRICPDAAVDRGRIPRHPGGAGQ